MVGNNGQNGGNGGNGGHVKILFDTLHSPAGKVAENILVNLPSTGRKWPDNFHDDAVAFVKLLEAPEVVAVHFTDYLLPTMRSPEDILKGGKNDFTASVSKLYELLGNAATDLTGSLIHSTTISGGDRGLGTSGNSIQSKNRALGSWGQRVVTFLQNHAAVRNLDVCYVHPIQCQMLLDKANFLNFIGGIDDKVASIVILERLINRLGPFAEIKTTDNEPPLWRAYRNNSDRLFTVEKGPSTQEPYAVQRLRGLRDDAKMMRQQILSGKDFFGRGRDDVPRGSYAFYHDTMDNFLKYFKTIEDMHLT